MSTGVIPGQSQVGLLNIYASHRNQLVMQQYGPLPGCNINTEPSRGS